MGEDGRFVFYSLGLLLIGFVLLLPTLTLISEPNGFKTFGIIAIGLLFYLIVVSIINSSIDDKNMKSKEILLLFSAPIALAYLVLKLSMPLMVLFFTAFWAVCLSALPFTALMIITNIILDANIKSSTICFVTLVCGSFVIVYLPRYVKWVIEIIPMVKHNEGKLLKSTWQISLGLLMIRMLLIFSLMSPMPYLSLQCTLSRYKAEDTLFLRIWIMLL